MKSLLVSNEFDSHVFIGHMVQSAYHLSEATLSYHLQDFIAVSYVIVQDLHKLFPLISVSLVDFDSHDNVVNWMRYLVFSHANWNQRVYMYDNKYGLITELWHVLVG